MNSTIDSKNKTVRARRTFADKLRDLLRPRRHRHDPLLVLNLAIFNSGESWAEIFSLLKIRENVG